MHKPAIFAVLALAVIGIAFATLPFGLAGIPPETWRPASAEHCSAPIVSAFRTGKLGGWFGYAPLTSTPVNVRLPTCKAAARRRLQYAGMFILAAGVIAIALRRNGGEAPEPQPDTTPGEA